MAAPKRFRVWDDEQMHYPHDNTGDFGLHQDGSLRDLAGGVNLLINQPRFQALASTGLVDSEGTEIYEGDVVEAGTTRFVVRWDNANACFEGTNDIGQLNDHFARLSCRVIGNVYEHPQLMEDEARPA